ncbi:MAG: plasmid partitioning protein RepB [Beijerinckiaceae bacterium]
MARKLNFDPLPESTDKASLVDANKVTLVRDRPLLGLDRPIKQASALGAISQSLGGINERVRKAEEIEQKLVAGQTIIDLDPAQIDVSFVRDRMEASEVQNAEFRLMIQEHGQAVPILVRPKSGQPDRYEVAFGHRRLRAARELGIKVRAVVRDLTDEQLVIAQGQENSGRTDLTFIERARFAANLEDRKFSREIIMAALNVDKAALSRLITMASRVPANIIDAIGPAPAFGRVRWQELTDLLDQDGSRKRANDIVSERSFELLETDKRFEALYNRLQSKSFRSRPDPWSAKDGTRAAKILRTGNKLTVTFDDRVAPAFGEFVRTRLQVLYDEYKQGGI